MSDLNLIDLVFSDVFCEIKEVRIDFLSENIESSFKLLKYVKKRQNLKINFVYF